MSVHADVLNVAQQTVLHRLAPVMASRGFYLAGGTAVALHLGHRRSVDLDWFTGEHLPDPLRLAQELRDDGLDLVTGQVEHGTLHGTIRGVRVSFLEYRYPLLQPTVAWAEHACPLASLDDLACMKLAAVAQRGAKKNFLDVYALGQRHKPMKQLLRLYQQKYDVDDISHLLYALVYFDEADGQRMPKLFWDLDWQTVKRRLREWVQEVAG